MREMMTESIRRDVCSAGIALLCEGGWEAFTTESIAKRLNVSRGVLYNYFKDKNDILYAIARSSIFELCDKLEEIAANGKTASERLAEMARCIIDTFNQKRKYHRAIMENVPPPKAKDSSHPAVVGGMRRQAIVERVIRDGVTNGEFRNVDFAAASILFNGSVHYICMINDIGDTAIDPVPTIQLFLRSIQNNHE
jgi:AcrR family transcriptional regulator